MLKPLGGHHTPKRLLTTGKKFVVPTKSSETPQESESVTLSTEQPTVKRKSRGWLKRMVMVATLSGLMVSQAIAGGPGLEKPPWLNPSTDPVRVTQTVSINMSRQMNTMANNLVQKTAIDSQDGEQVSRNIGGGMQYARVSQRINGEGNSALMKLRTGSMTKEQAVEKLTHTREAAWQLGLTQTAKSEQGATVTPSEAQAVMDFLIAGPQHQK